MSLSDFRQMRKGNFHLHLTGSLSPQDLRALAKVTGLNLTSYEPIEKHFESFEDPAIWSIAKDITSLPLGLSGALKAIQLREHRDNVVYVEITLNPFGMVRRGMTSYQIIEILKDASVFGANLGIKSKFKFGVNRKDGPGSVTTVKEVFLACPEELRCAIDLNGDERLFPTSVFVDVFKELSEQSIPTTVHAGEHIETVDSLEEALLMNPARIVHGIAALKDETLIETMADKGIAIEMALTSNIKRGIISDDSPLLYNLFKKYNLAVLPGTDDPAFFGNTMSDEFAKLLAKGLEMEEIGRMNDDALSFVALT
jgi:adenosine deaminase